MLKKIRETVLHDESISGCDKVVNYSLSAKAATDRIAHAIKEAEFNKQVPCVFFPVYAERGWPYTKAPHSGLVYKKERVTGLLLRDWKSRLAATCVFIWGSIHVHL